MSDRSKSDALAFIQLQSAQAVLEGAVNHFGRAKVSGMSDDERAVVIDMANKTVELIRQGYRFLGAESAKDRSFHLQTAQHNENEDADI